MNLWKTIPLSLCLCCQIEEKWTQYYYIKEKFCVLLLLLSLLLFLSLLLLLSLLLFLSLSEQFLLIPSEPMLILMHWVGLMMLFPNITYMFNNHKWIFHKWICVFCMLDSFIHFSWFSWFHWIPVQWKSIHFMLINFVTLLFRIMSMAMAKVICSNIYQ